MIIVHTEQAGYLFALSGLEIVAIALIPLVILIVFELFSRSVDRLKENRFRYMKTLNHKDLMRYLKFRKEMT